MVVPEWIRSVGNGQVELLAGWEPGELLTILTSRDGGFHTLIEETRHLNNLAAVTKIYRY